MPPTDKRFTIGIIGKQDIAADQWNSVYTQIKSKISDIVANNPDKNFTGYSAMAKGADTIFAEVVTREFKQPLKIILPFSIEEYRNNFSDATSQQVFDDWTKRYGIEKTIIEEKLLDKDLKEEAYFQTGKYFIDQCDEVIIVWDHLKPGGKGGTADMLGLLATHKKTTGDIRLVKVSPSHGDEFHRRITEQKRIADKKAIQLKKRYTYTWRSSVLLGWLASICFAVNAVIYYDGGWINIMTIGEFLLALAIFVIVRTYSKSQHQNLVRQRIKAERLRLIEIFYSANIKIRHAELTSNSDPEIAELIEQTNEEIKKHASGASYYSYYCVKKLIENQIHYHHSLLKKGSFHWLDFYKVIREILIGLFLINLLLSFISTIVDYWQHTPFYSHSWSVFLGIFLSTTFATIETILFFTEWRAEQIHSGNMLSFFRTKLNSMRNGHNNDQPEDLLKDISIKMLTENRDWEAIIREKEIELKVP